MNYKSIYDSIVCRGRKRSLSEYTEKHHIIPRSFGGSDDLHNIVALTAREHYIAHLLLWRTETGKNKQKMAHALSLLKSNGSTTSRLYEAARRDISASMMGNSRCVGYKVKRVVCDHCGKSTTKRALREHHNNCHLDEPVEQLSRITLEVIRVFRNKYVADHILGSTNREVQKVLAGEKYYAHDSYWNYVGNTFIKTTYSTSLKGTTMSESRKKTLRVPKRNKPPSKAIVTPHGQFNSIMECANALNRAYSTIYEKVVATNNTDWYYV